MREGQDLKELLEYCWGKAVESVQGTSLPEYGNFKEFFEQEGFNYRFNVPWEGTGVFEIHKERRDHIVKHGRSVLDDFKYNKEGQLSAAAAALITLGSAPQGWDGEIWERMIRKPYKDRVIIAGALLAAEADRLLAIESEIYNEE